MGNFPEVSNYNRLFLQVNRLFQLQLAVGSPRSLLLVANFYCDYLILKQLAL
jgi:hypothetical protein